MTELEIRLAMLAGDYDPVVTVGKSPVEPGWQKKIHRSADEVRAATTQYPAAKGTGINNHRVLSFDADITDPAIAQAAFSVIEDRYGDRGEVLYRGGTGSKFMTLLAIDEPMPKVVRQFKGPNGVIHQIEARGSGQQSLAFGYNPDAKRNYFWPQGKDPTNTPRSALPLTTEQEVLKLLDDVVTMAVEQFDCTHYDGCDKPRTNGQGKNSNEHKEPLDVDAALAAIHYGNIDDTWIRCIWSLLRVGTPADDVFGRILQATQDAPGCQSDPRRNKWAKTLAGKMSRALWDEPDFATCLSYEMQIRWHQLVSDGHRPRLIWRGDLKTLYVAKPHSADDTKEDANPKADGKTDTKAESGTGKAGAKANELAIPLTTSEWLRRDLPLPDRLLGDWFTTTSRVLLSADTGIGKTNFGMTISGHVAGGVPFLHWQVHRTARILYMDGEMSRRLLKRRAEDVVRRLGFIPENLFLFSREDVEAFPPLNTPAGYAFLNRLIDTIGNVDAIVFDNIMALLEGDQKDEESWTRVLPLVTDLTKRCIGQLWINHTGHDATRSYGSKTKEWRLDTTIHLTAVERSDTDLSFKLEFRKARERTPENRREFQDVTIALVNDQWVGSETVKQYRPKEGSVDAKVFEVLLEVLASNGTEIKGQLMVKSDVWRDACIRYRIFDGPNPRSNSIMFNSHRRKLIAANMIFCEGELVGERK